MLSRTPGSKQTSTSRDLRQAKLFHVKHEETAIPDVSRETLGQRRLSRFSRMTTRLPKDSRSGYVARHAKGGITMPVASLAVVLRNKKRWPPGLIKACRLIRRRGSRRTARMVNKSCASWRSGLVNSSSNREQATSASRIPNVRAASRRNTDFRVFASTIRSRSPGNESANGIAGDPPPLPMSMSRATSVGACLAATSGSMRSRSSASGVGSARLSPERLILLFQVASSR
jgi:hypothetical protein